MPLIPGIQIAGLPVMGGSVMLVMCGEEAPQIIIQTAVDVCEPLILMLAWIHPRGSQYIWLTKSENAQKPINAYLT
jgi:predicted alpha/beta-fold hydrolase